MLDLRNTILTAVASAIVAAGGSWWLTAEYYQARHEAVLAKQKAAATQVLQEATQEVLNLQKINQDLITILEVQHADNQQKIDKALADNRRLARELGGMRDPYAAAGCGALSATSGTAADLAHDATAGRLSAEAEEFLLALAFEADRAAEYAGVCHRWAVAYPAVSK